MKNFFLLVSFIAFVAALCLRAVPASFRAGRGGWVQALCIPPAKRVSLAVCA